MILCLAILVELRLVTDKRTDRQTDGDRPIVYTALAYSKNCSEGCIVSSLFWWIFMLVMVKQLAEMKSC